ncbi:MAG: hypothetical protein JXR64_03570 [Spirochaetales bacterium]|nr:hypothetical protein [Spirochaetales bacterium]
MSSCIEKKVVNKISISERAGLYKFISISSSKDILVNSFAELKRGF